MKSPFTVSIVIALAALISSDAVPRAAFAAPAAEDVQVINVAAKKYEFDPATIHVKQGTKVQLKITSTDHAHGMKIQDFPEGDKTMKAGLVFSSGNDCAKAAEGQTTTVEFVAQTSGTYPFRCCVHCGWHHRAMKGEVVVDP